jgi:hypothetical protein
VTGVPGMNKTWTPEMDSALRLMWDDGASTYDISICLSADFPARIFNRNMVIGRARRLGLKPRPSPILKSMLIRLTPTGARD